MVIRARLYGAALQVFEVGLMVALGVGLACSYYTTSCWFYGSSALKVLWLEKVLKGTQTHRSDTRQNLTQNSEYELIPLYAQLLKLSPKEKTTRLLISSLYNLLSTNRDTLLPAAVLARMPSLLQNINGRHLSDPDLLDDLKNLTDMLDEYTKTQTTFDEYAAEVNSGHLRWSPPHRNPTFWAENARKILDHEKGALPKKLADIMKKPWEQDKQVLAIACNDVGHLVKEVPEKRSQLEKLGLKTRVMELMQEPNEAVRWESLNALSGWLRYSFETK